MEKYRVDTEKIHAEIVQAWEINYTDHPCDMVYDQSIALDRFSRANAKEMLSLVIVRHDDGSREFHKGAVAHMTAKHLSR